MVRKPVTTDICGQLVVLGSGTSIGVPAIGCGCPTCHSDNPKNKRTRCAVIFGLPEGNMLVDTPPELRLQLNREGIGVAHALVFTHEHADHLHGMDDVRLFQHYLGGPLPVYCTNRVERRVRHTFDYAFSDAMSYSKQAVPQLEFRRIGREAFHLLGAEVQPIPLMHGRMEVLGFRVGNVAYCTDTNEIPPESWPLLAGLEVLILGALRPDPHPTHFNLQEAVEVARKIGARQTYFTHISCRLEHEQTNAELPAGMELAYDGLRIPLTRPIYQ